jgi:PPP family 3-phenylpropionic acid transporter
MIQETSRKTGSSTEANSIRVMYLGYYMALGAFMPYINLYYERAGLSGVQIGFLAASILVTTSLTAIPWGAIADRFQLHQRILGAAFVLAPIFIFFLSQVSSYALMIPLVLAYALSTAPIIPLLDGSALEIARLKRITYGELRVGGTMGWIISVWLVGILIQAFDIHWLFYCYIAFMGLTLVYALSRPPRRGSTQIVLWSNLRLLITDSSVVFFLVSIFLVAVGSGAVLNFFSLYLDGIGAGEGLIGLAWALAAVSEIPVMMYAGALMRRIGSAGLLKLAFLVYAARWLLLSFIESPGLAVAVQLLHGLSFAAFLTAGVTYLSERTPEGLSTTAQAVFNVVCFGLASMVGALLGGYLYDSVGMAALLRVLSLVTVAGLILFWLTARPGRTAYATHA